MAEAIQFTTPVGRLVGGSLYKPQDKDASGAPLVIKSGPNVGKPTVRYWLPLAIPKGAEQHWNQTPWGALIWKAGASGFPAQHQSPSFAWKVIDGDSTVPNKRGRKPCDNEGYPGHWVLNFGGTFAPKAVNANGSEYHSEPGYIKAGDWVQIAGSVAPNGTQANPGVYLNYSLVSLQGLGEEISQGPDPTQVGFGTMPLPPGVSLTPPPGLPATGAAPAPAAAPVVVQPNPAFLTPPPLPPAAPPVAPPPAAPARVMTAKAGGVTFEAMIAAGWTEAQLREHGYLV